LFKPGDIQKISTFFAAKHILHHSMYAVAFSEERQGELHHGLFYHQSSEKLHVKLCD